MLSQREHESYYMEEESTRVMYGHTNYKLQPISNYPSSSIRVPLVNPYP